MTANECFTATLSPISLPFHPPFHFIKLKGDIVSMHRGEKGERYFSTASPTEQEIRKVYPNQIIYLARDATLQNLSPFSP